MQHFGLNWSSKHHSLIGKLLRANLTEIFDEKEKYFIETNIGLSFRCILWEKVIVDARCEMAFSFSFEDLSTFVFLLFQLSVAILKNINSARRHLLYSKLSEILVFAVFYFPLILPLFILLVFHQNLVPLLSPERHLT